MAQPEPPDRPAAPQDCQPVSDNSLEDKIREKKRTRKRRKRIFNAIREQIEFYFSDSNLRNDQYMRQLMMRSAGSKQLTGNEPVPFSEIVHFNKIRSLSTSEEEVRRALRSSDVLLVSDDGSSVSRKQPADFNKDVDACTLYVENLPNDVTHDWLKSLFSSYGTVNYISIPKFKDKRTKGFAFIEFSTESAVRNACRTFGAQVPPQNNSDPSADTASTNEQDSETAKTGTKRKLAPGEDSDQQLAKKKNRNSIIDSDGTAAAGRQFTHGNRACSKQDVTLGLELIKLNLRVMSKQEWSEWKRKYRQLQVQNMKNVKNAIQSADQPAVPSAVASKLASLTNPSLIPTIPAKVISYDSNCGSVIKLAIHKKMGDAFEEALTKTSIRKAADPIRLAYVDIDGKSNIFQDDLTVTYTCFIRCFTSSEAESLLGRNAFGSLGTASKLTGEEEKRYSERIQESREYQKQKQQNKNRKGYKKWVQRAEAIVRPAAHKAEI